MDVAVSSVKAATTFTVSGSIYISHPCETAGTAYSDIRQGGEVYVRIDGKTAAVGELGPGNPGYGTCTFIFVVQNVPAGEKFYELEVTRRGVTTYTEQQLRTAPELLLR